jgi:hypothetical protein
LPKGRKSILKSEQLSLVEDFQIYTSKESSRKYPDVIWFPRSKTDPREIREVLKLALITQEENPDKYFNDKTLGEKMATVGSINIVGLKGKEYIESYSGKSIGDVSYITNARMLMRLFRFLGFVSRINKGQYVLTELGKLFSKFNGDFPSIFEGESEESILLNSLSDFSFYSVNDDKIYRDTKFKIRPFVWLLFNLSIEPQCIFQLIVTCFASKNESKVEYERITTILNNLRNHKTSLSREWEIVNLAPNDYACVHNFYDSAKILVYLGTSLGLITKDNNPKYGKSITGEARHMKSANTFYLLTDKGKNYLDFSIVKSLYYYEDLYSIFENENILQASFILAALNCYYGCRKIISININYLNKLLDKDVEYIINKFSELNINISYSKNFLRLEKPVAFNFWQSIPPEYFHLNNFNSWYKIFMEDFNKKNIDSQNFNVEIVHPKEKTHGDTESKFILNKEDKIYYDIPQFNDDIIYDYVRYPDKESIYGGTDRFPSRISPTNSVFVIKDKIRVNNDLDALDLLIPLRFPDDKLRNFIHKNFSILLTNFISKSDNWEKDQHYTWVRNCFRHLGCSAIYSGSGGMLSRADVSIIEPFIAGIEIKSPRENRGTLNTKAIRQAVDAKIQVANAYPKKKNYPRSAIAIGRRISPNAIKEEKKWATEGQPVLLINDVILYFITLQTIDFTFSKTEIINLFTKINGVLSCDILYQFLKEIMIKSKEKNKAIEFVKSEIDLIIPYL